MTSYAKTIAFLYGLQGRGMKLGLRNIRILLKAAGNPEKSFRTVHVAGTNGKGSTCAFLASIFQESGYRTGLYTSPHLRRFTERIRVDGREIDSRRLAGYLDRLHPAIESSGATFFEATTCIAFQYFADEAVDIAVIETGLGGRLDSTNVLMPLASVITTIALDHTDLLGSTIRSIAVEKGGIIKPHVPVILGDVPRDAADSLRRIAQRKNARLFHSPVLVREYANGRGEVAYVSKSISTGWVQPGLSGGHQRSNARLAVAVCEILLRRGEFNRQYPGVSAGTIRKGIERVRSNSGLGGRLERAGPRRRFILDVAHNPEGVRTLVRSLLDEGSKSVVAVFGVMKDKNAGPMLEELSRICTRIVAVRPHTPRAMSVQAICLLAGRVGLSASPGGTVAAGLRMASKARGEVLVTGSHYVVGEALGVLAKKRP